MISVLGGGGRCIGRSENMMIGQKGISNQNFPQKEEQQKTIAKATVVLKGLDFYVLCKKEEGFHRFFFPFIKSYIQLLMGCISQL